MEGFDFARWRTWVEAKGRQLADSGQTTKFGSNDKYLPSFGLELEKGKAIGSFRCYSNGLVDFDVCEILGPKKLEFAACEMMIEVSDANFETTFGKFMTEYEKVN